MDYIVNGGNRLSGEIAVYGAKNCALALLGATILTDEEVILHNCPNIVDVENMIRLLRSMGKKILRSGDTVSVSGKLSTTVAPREIATLLRGSALILGSTLAKYHQIDLPLPGGCAIGARPMDIHLLGLERLNINVSHSQQSVKCVGMPVGAKYSMRFASVGATENLVCAATLARGETVLDNCATEPEVAALEQLLIKMGAKINGVGSQRVVVEGVKTLHGAEYDIIPDRIVTATYISCGVATLGDVTVTNCCPTHIRSFVDILQPHCYVSEYAGAIRVVATEPANGYGTIVTAPYPLFPTDMQSLVLSLATCCNGQTVICEKLFENRLSHNASQLNKMGACVSVDGDTATVVGSQLHGALLQAKDLRGGAGLVIAALSANGQSRISDIEHIDRGYINLAQSLATLGADIRSTNS